MWCDVMWSTKVMWSKSRLPLSNFFLLQYAFKRTMQNKSTTHTWPSSMVCDLDMTACLFVFLSQKLWHWAGVRILSCETQMFLSSILCTRLKVHTTFSVDVLKYSKVTNGWSCIFWPLSFLLVFVLEFTLDIKLCIWALQVI